MAKAFKHKATQVRSRMLWPFFVERDCVRDVVAQLTGRHVSGKQAWEEADVPDLYKDNFLDYIRNHWFGYDRSVSTYLRVPDELARDLLGGFTFQDRRADGDDATHRGALVDDGGEGGLPGIELFLIAPGVGLLSIALTPGDEVMPLESVRDWLAALHIGDREDSPMILRDGGAIEGLVDKEARLFDLINTLLNGPEGDDLLPGYEAVQRSLSAYTVVGFDEHVTFGTADDRAPFGPQLAALVGLWRSDYAGAADGALPVNELVMTECHWTAVNLRGAVHLVNDQPGDHPFNAHRVRRTFDKHFVQYLTALLQLWCAHRVSKDAVDLLHGTASQGPAEPSTEEDRIRRIRAGLPDLRKQILDFTLCGQFGQLSTGDRATRYYHLVRDALRVQEAWDHLKTAVAELDAELESRGLEATVKNILHVQHKIEWVEVFLISVYVVELAHIFALMLGFNHTYAAIGILVLAVGSAFGGIVMLRPWTPVKVDDPPKPVDPLKPTSQERVALQSHNLKSKVQEYDRRVVLVALVVALTAFLILGLWLFRAHHDGGGGHAEAGPASESRHVVASESGQSGPRLST